MNRKRFLLEFQKIRDAEPASSVREGKIATAVRPLFKHEEIIICKLTSGCHWGWKLFISIDFGVGFRRQVQALGTSPTLIVL